MHAHAACTDRNDDNIASKAGILGAIEAAIPDLHQRRIDDVRQVIKESGAGVD